MKRLAVVCLLAACAVFSSGDAHAGPVARGFPSALGVTDGSVTVPVEWDGIWTTADSTYDCTTGDVTYSTAKDTICGGTTYSQGAPISGITFSCSGTADATTIHETCNGSTTFLSCTVTYNVQVDVVRTTDSFRSVSTTTITYSGTDPTCTLIPGSCTRVVTYGTRTGPSPPAYCTTPAKRTSWGRLKILYR